MKYMTFNRSCAYATLANLLEEQGIAYEDYEIVKALSLPYIMDYRQEDDRYVAGPMIQGYPWFQYFLNSLGFDLVEQLCSLNEALVKLDEGKYRYKMSLKINPKGKMRHAVLFEGKEEGEYKFLNPKRKDSLEPDYYFLNKEELVEKLGGKVMMAYLVKMEQPIPFSLSNHLRVSLEYLNQYQDRLNEFCCKEQEFSVLVEARDTLFAPLMLDILSMMEIIGEMELATDIKTIRSTYMDLMKESRPLRLADKMSLEDLNKIFSTYRRIMESYSLNVGCDKESPS